MRDTGIHGDKVRYREGEESPLRIASPIPNAGSLPPNCKILPAPEEIMSKYTRLSHPIYHLLPTEIEGFDPLAELALDMHWSWNHATDEVWRQLDPDLWEITHNPWVVLQTVSRDQIERVLADPLFRRNVDGLLEASLWRPCDVILPAWKDACDNSASSRPSPLFATESVECFSITD